MLYRKQLKNSLEIAYKASQSSYMYNKSNPAFVWA